MDWLLEFHLTVTAVAAGIAHASDLLWNILSYVVWFFFH